ncbi:hypothetical protein SAMN05660649_01214 [Desulfotomaculum arcticum]|uniref:Uncharacterized protein n=1 Tax=Desulfotruncus arcticus DSM 17038 TaxID=1121424 RepID=A0A1I2QMV6_9FIRM|nr:hypothetical protein [Desulfotruncus arcticus]SFG27006.1 hypothetical protein SAMN05660649_01214 [Desulfotomaculum arcticum] [Desulfotruncus arcticus DSM 17038]
MIINKKQFITGIVLLLIFTAVFITIMSPLANGKTLVQAADDLFNQLTKGSTYIIPKVIDNAAKFEGTSFQVSVKAESLEDAEKYAKVFSAAGAQVTSDGGNVNINGDLGKVSVAALKDADVEFQNNGAQLKSEYGMESREVIYCWYNGIKALSAQYKLDNKVAELGLVNDVMTKGLEPAYNFEGIQAVNVKERSGITTFMLLFYVLYTILYGFAIMFIFEGLGIVASSHGEKAEA